MDPQPPKYVPLGPFTKSAIVFLIFLGKIWRVTVVAGLFCYSIHIPDEWSGTPYICTFKSSDMNHVHFKCFLIDK